MQNWKEMNERERVEDLRAAKADGMSLAGYHKSRNAAYSTIVAFLKARKVCWTTVASIGLLNDVPEGMTFDTKWADLSADERIETLKKLRALDVKLVRACEALGGNYDSVRSWLALHGHSYASLTATSMLSPDSDDAGDNEACCRRHLDALIKNHKEIYRANMQRKQAPEQLYRGATLTIGQPATAVISSSPIAA